MNTRSTAILGGVAVVVLALGLLFGTGNREQQADAPAAQPAFPGLPGKLGDAASIEIAQAGKTLRIVRAGDAWTLPDKSGYPAEAKHVHELLAGLAELRLAEPRTSNPDDYARLGVSDPPKDAPKDPKDAGGTLLRVLDGGGGAIAQLLLGHTRIGSGGSGDGVYVRKPGAAQAWLAEGRLAAETDPMAWVDHAIVDIPADKILGVTVTHGDQTLSFARADGKLALQAPADHPKLDQFKLDDIGRALENLTLDDVKPAPAPGTPQGRAVFATSDGLAITATVSKAGDIVWAEFAVAPNDKAANDKARDAAAALQARLAGWAFAIGSWKEAALVPTLDQLKSDQPPPAQPAPAAAPVQK